MRSTMPVAACLPGSRSSLCLPLRQVCMHASENSVCAQSLRPSARLFLTQRPLLIAPSMARCEPRPCSRVAACVRDTGSSPLPLSPWHGRLACRPRRRSPTNRLGGLVNYQIGVGGQSDRAQTQFIVRSHLSFFSSAKATICAPRQLGTSTSKTPSTTFPSGSASARSSRPKSSPSTSSLNPSSPWPFGEPGSRQCRSSLA